MKKFTLLCICRVLPIVIGALVGTFDLHAEFIDFSQLTNVTILPRSFSWRGDDGSVGKVSVSLLSNPGSGAPIISGSSAGGLYMGLNDSRGQTGSETSWFIRLSFDKPVSIDVNNFGFFRDYSG